MKMLRFLLSIVLLVAAACPSRLAAQTLIDVDSLKVFRDKDSVQVSMLVDLRKISVNKTDLLWLTPRLTNGKDSIDFPTVCVYGRNPYYSYVRTGPYANYADMQIRGKLRKGSKQYIQNVPFEKWMDNARLVLVCARTNSCGTIIDEQRKTAYTPPKPIYRPRPEEEMTRRAPTVYAKQGVAHIDFILDSIVIHPEYHDNTRELNKIKATIDSVVKNPNANPKLLTIHGYASPEGPYKHNVWLADERTKALARYIDNIYKFPKGFIQTESTPEDWEGFERLILESDLPHKREILDIARSDREPDAKMLLIKRRYPAEYQIMLARYLPYLRHSDYRIEYTLRSEMRRFDEEEEMKKAYIPPQLPQRPLPPTAPLEQFKQFKPIFAIKTNLLFDLALCPNIEVEVPFGRARKWSVMAEYWTPWYVWKHNSRSYEFQTFGVELRRWFRSCRGGLPPLSGFFVGAYYAFGKYDLQWDKSGEAEFYAVGGTNRYTMPYNGEGDQGEFQSVGATIGYSWVLSKHFNLEASVSGGYFWGPRRHYVGAFDDSHLMWQYTGSTSYAGPTKAKVSLVWLIGPTKRIRLPKPVELREPQPEATEEPSPQPAATQPERKASTPPQPRLTAFSQRAGYAARTEKGGEHGK